MRSTVQVTPVALVSRSADAAPTTPVELSADLLALVAGGSVSSGSQATDAVSVGTDPSPRGGW
jgi:hypothetical protein